MWLFIVNQISEQLWWTTVIFLTKVIDKINMYQNQSKTTGFDTC